MRKLQSIIHSLFLIVFMMSFDAVLTSAAALLVNINEAPAEMMAEQLEGVGSKKAQAIVAYRQSHGPFQSIEDLKQVKGIGERLIALNKEKLTLNEVLVEKSR